MLRRCIALVSSLDRPKPGDRRAFNLFDFLGPRQHGANASSKLTFQTDHSAGADQTHQCLALFDNLDRIAQHLLRQCQTKIIRDRLRHTKLKARWL